MKKAALNTIIEALTTDPELRDYKPSIGYWDRPTHLTVETMRLFDRLDTTDFFQEKWIGDCFPAIAVTKHVHFNYWDNEQLDAFRAKVKDLPLTDEDLAILFALDYQLIAALNRYLPNLLLTGKDDIGTIAVINRDTPFHELLTWLLKKVPVVTADHVLDIQRTEMYTEAEEMEILRLLIAEQYEEVEIRSGSKVVASALAAIMRTHADKGVRKWARKNYTRIGTDAFLAHVRQYHPALLKDSWRLDEVANHPDIDREIFLLMALTINKKDHLEVNMGSCQHFHPGIALFDEVTWWEFQNMPVNLEELGELLASKPFVKRLVLSHVDFGNSIPSCIGEIHTLTCLDIITGKDAREIQIPASIGQLTNLRELSISGDCFIPAVALQTLTGLEALTFMRGKCDDWDVLQHLPGLRSLSLSGNDITRVPEGIYNMQQLEYLNLSDNHLAGIVERFGTLRALKSICLSNCGLTEFPYSLSQLDLDYVFMPGNNIPVIAADKLADRVITWHEVYLQGCALRSMQFRKGKIRIRRFDICHNQLTALDPSLFTDFMEDLDAEENKIVALPPEVTIPAFTRFNMNCNCLTELPGYLKDMKPGFYTANDNNISKIAPILYEPKASRWGIAHGNPISEEMKEKTGRHYL